MDVVLTVFSRQNTHMEEIQISRKMLFMSPQTRWLGKHLLEVHGHVRLVGAEMCSRVRYRKYPYVRAVSTDPLRERGKYC